MRCQEFDPAHYIGAGAPGVVVPVEIVAMRVQQLGVAVVERLMRGGIHPWPQKDGIA